MEAAAALTGEAPAAVMFGTEAPLLSQLGMQTIVLGAGSITVAHRPDEYLPLDQVAKATDVYAGLIERFCVEGG